MKIIGINRNDSNTIAAKIFLNGGVVVFPTDTVYGIGCLLDTPVIKRLYKIKNRPLSRPTSILITKNLYHIIHSSEKSGIKIPSKMRKDFWDGRITVIFPMINFKQIFPQIIIKNDKIGIRLPKYPWLEKLIDTTGPIVASSANKKGDQPPAKFDEIKPAIIEKADLVIRTDEELSGQPSRIYDLELKKYLR